MRIAVLTDTYKPQINGVSVSIDIFRRELERLGHEVVIYAPRYYSGQPDGVREYRFFSIPYPIPRMRENRITLPVSPRLSDFSRRGFDVIHSHVPSPLCALAGRYGRRYAIPHVHTYHTLWMEYVHYAPVPKGFARAGIRYLSRAVGSISDLIICPSETLARELVTYGVTTPLDILPTGLDFDHGTECLTRHDLEREYGVPLEGEIITFVGRLGREKNVEFLFAVMKELGKRGRRPHLLVVGNGPDRARLRRTAAVTDLAHSVFFTGYVERKRVFSLLSLSSVLAFPSMTETQGIVILEAMSVGRPVVAIDAMGVHDVMADGLGGFLCGEDVHEFSDRICELFDDPALYRRKASEGVTKSRLWSSRAMTERLVGIYERLIYRYRRGLPYDPQDRPG